VLGRRLFISLGEHGLRLETGKWLRYSGILLVGFPRTIPERRYSMLRLCRRCRFSVFGIVGLELLGRL